MLEPWPNGGVVGSGGSAEHRGRDLDDRDEIAEFVTRFYRDIAQDERFHLYFHDLAHIDWPSHIGALTEFWTDMLLGGPADTDRAGSGLSGGTVIEAHRWLHDTEPFDDALFERWLELFDTTLDQGWHGPSTDRARRRGHGLAWAMAKRLTGCGVRASS